jgi:hypothetical protein
MTDTITKAREICRSLRLYSSSALAELTPDDLTDWAGACRQAIELIESLTAPMSETEALERALDRTATALDRLIKCVGEKTRDGKHYRWAHLPTFDTVQEAMEANNANASLLHAHEPLPVKDEDADAAWLRALAEQHWPDHSDNDRLEAIAARLEEKRQ